MSGNPGGRPRTDPALRRAAQRAAEAAVIELLSLARDSRLSWTQRRRACLDLIHLAYGRRGIVPPATEIMAGVAAELLGYLPPSPSPPAAARRPQPRISLVR